MDFIYSRLFFVVFLAIINVGIVILFYKWKVIQYYQLYKKRWMPSCNFCLFFWMAFIEIIKFMTFGIILTWPGIICTLQFALFAAVISRKFL